VPNDGAGDKVMYDTLNYANRILLPSPRGSRAAANSGSTRGQVSARGITLKEMLPLTVEELKDMRDVGSMSEPQRQAAVARAITQTLMDFERTWDFYFAQWLTGGALTTSVNACPGVATGTVYLHYGNMAIDSTVAVDLGMDADNIIGNVSASWATSTTDILGDLETQSRVIGRKTGVRARHVIMNATTFQYVLENDAFMGSEYIKAEYARTGGVGDAFGFTWDIIDDTVSDAADLFNGGAGALQPMIPNNCVILTGKDNTACGRALVECEPDDNQAPAGFKGFYPFTDEEAEHPHNIKPGATETAIPMVKVPNSQVVFKDVTDTTP